MGTTRRAAVAAAAAAAAVSDDAARACEEPRENRGAPPACRRRRHAPNMSPARRPRGLVVETQANFAFARTGSTVGAFAEWTIEAPADALAATTARTQARHGQSKTALGRRVRLRRQI